MGGDNDDNPSDGDAHLPSNLLDRMRSLVEEFGSIKCADALAKIDADRGGDLEYRTIHTFPDDYEVVLGDDSYEHKLIDDMKKLQVANYGGELESFRLQRAPSWALLSTILETLKHYKGLKNPDGSPRRWKEFSLETDDPDAAILLDFPEISLFRAIDVDFQDQDVVLPEDGDENDEDAERYAVVSTEAMEGLQKQIMGGNLESLAFGYCSMTGECTEILRDMILSNKIQRLHLESVYLWDPQHSFPHLADSFNKQVNKLEHLSFTVESWDDRELCKLIGSIAALPALKTLELAGNRQISKSVLRKLSDLVSNSSCSLQELSLNWIDEDLVDDEDEDLERDNVSLKILLKGLERNKSIKSLVLSSSDFGRDDLDKLLLFALSDKCSISHFGLVELKIREISNLGKRNIISTESSHKNALRTLDLRDNQILNPESCHKNILTLSQWAENLFRLSNIGLQHSAAQAFFEGIHRDRFLELGAKLERNQVGRILLHPKVAPGVPVGLWSIVLERAANSKSLFYDKWIGNRPPLDGIFFLIQNLVLGGIITDRALDLTAAKTGIKRQPKRLRTKSNGS